jgi:hypothetical protein
MCRRLLSMVALAAVLALGACSEQQQKTATGPEFAGGPPIVSPACDFSLVRGLVNSYFSSPLQQDAKSLEQQMETAGSRTSGAVQRGFDIMSLIGQASRQGTPSPLVGSNLTKALMRCMFELPSAANFPGFPDSYDFQAALTKVAGGAYYVRGAGDPTNTVIGTDYSGVTAENLSAVAPAGGTWTSILSGNTLSGGRVLIYGSLVTAGPPLTYDWKLMPPNSSFASPFALVSVCDGNTDANAVVHESSLGFLPYIATSICLGTQSLTTLDAGWGPRAILQKAAHWSTALLTPQLLQAAMVKTGSGGTSSGFKSEFKTNSLTAGLTVTFKKNEPPAKVKLNTQFPVTVVTTALDDEDVASGVANTCVYLTGSNNNGTPTQLLGPHDSRCTDVAGALSVVSDAGGTAAFKDATFTVGPKVTKNGGLVLNAFAQVIGRSITGNGQAKTNVSP